MGSFGRSQLPSPLVPYVGWEWVGGPLPLQGEPWPSGRDPEEPSADELTATLASQPWVMSSTPHVFISDPQADGGALIRSLVASGGVAKTGPSDTELELTPFGSQAVFVIGGNCFGRGPSSLRVLELLARLRSVGARLELLAGDQDLRTLLGLGCLGERSPRSAHLFVRMAHGLVPFLRELWDQRGAAARVEVDDRAAERLMLPGEGWAEAFAACARDLEPGLVAYEVMRIDEAVAQFRVACRQYELSPAQAYTAAAMARSMLLDEAGELAWFSRALRPCLRAGSLLFVHAGVDDRLAWRFREGGGQALEQEFRKLWRDDPLALYHGPVGNVVRTRYRSFDGRLTARGVRALHELGIYAILHGHECVLDAPRMLLRSGLLHLRCGALLDATARAAEGLRAPGAAATVVDDGRILGINADRDRIRVFEPSKFCSVVTLANGPTGGVHGALEVEAPAG